MSSEFTVQSIFTYLFILFAFSLNAQQVEIEGNGRLLDIEQDLFTSNMVFIRATDSAGGSDVNSGSDIVTIRSATTGFGQFIEFERGIAVVARVNTDGSAQFKSIEYPDGTIQSTAPVAPNNPLAYAAIKSSGSQTSGTTNVTSDWDPSSEAYIIEINSINYNFTEFSTVVTPNSIDVDKVWTTDDGSGNLFIQFLDDNNKAIQAEFHFITYQ